MRNMFATLKSVNLKGVLMFENLEPFGGLGGSCDLWCLVTGLPLLESQ
jgi:hypothetical protein